MSGGFATMHPNNSLLVNAVEAYELDAFSREVRSLARLPVRIIDRLAQAIQSRQSEAQRVASGAGSEDEKAEANAELDVRRSQTTFCALP